MDCSQAVAAARVIDGDPLTSSLAVTGAKFLKGKLCSLRDFPGTSSRCKIAPKRLRSPDFGEPPVEDEIGDACRGLNLIRKCA